MEDAAAVGVPGDSRTSVEVLKEHVREFCEAREWDPFHGAKELAIGIITEAAELLEHFRFLSADEVEELLRQPDRRREVESEIADVLIFVLRLAQKHEIDLSQAVVAKLAENEKRYPVETARGSNRKVRSP